MPGQLISLRVDGELADAAAMLSRYGLPLVYDPRAAALPVRLSMTDVPAMDVLLVLASFLGPGTIAAPVGGGAWYLGPPRDADRVTRLLRISSGESAEWLEAYRQVGGEDLTVAIVGDTAIVSSPADALERVVELHESLSSPRRQFLADVTLVEVSERVAQELGIEWSLSGLGTVAGSTQKSTVEAALVLEAELRAEQTKGRASVVATQRMLLVEGTEAEMQVGDSVPVPQRTVSPEGTVTVTGFDRIETGVLLRMEARAVAGGAVSLNLEPEVSSVSGFVEGSPIISRRRWQSTAVLDLGGLLVIGGLAERRDSQEQRNVPGFKLFDRRSESGEARRLYVFVRLLPADQVHDVALNH